jgi:phosphatidylglycerophosphate synthase
MWIVRQQLRTMSMSDYRPRWRRPIADVFRQTAGFAVHWCVRWGVHPNLVSYSSIFAAAAAGLCFWQAAGRPVLLLVAVGFCYLRLWLNMLDGMVALAAGKASRSGEIANELPDRISDVLIFVGVAHSQLCHLLAGYWVALMCLLVAYVGTLGQAVGVQREFSGVMAKPWRMVALHVGAWTTLALLWWHEGKIRFGGLTVLDWTLLAILVGGVQTIALRLTRLLRAIHELEAKVAPTTTPKE